MFRHCWARHPSFDLFALFFPIILIGCSGGSSFSSSGGGGGNAVARDSAEAAPAANQPAEVLTNEDSYDSLTLKKSGKLDIIWTIDNSGSMSEEAAQVRVNFKKFIDSLGSSTDLRLSLISASAPPVVVAGLPDTSVTLDSSALSQGHFQLNVPVASTNLLAIAAAAICPLDSTDGTLPISPASTFKICGQTFNPSASGGLEAARQVITARAGLQKQLRADAKKIFVFVTDDNARGVIVKDFQQALAATPGFESSTVFAFRGKVSQAAGCSVANPGLAYEALATATGGAVYDICLPDWGESFGKLKDQAVRIANSDVQLTKENIVEVIEVKVGEKVLEKQDYKLEGQRLLIDPKALAGVEGKILVRYRYEKKSAKLSSTP